MERIRRTVFTNTDNVPLAIFIELEGWDYWMLPGESLEIRASVWADEAEFEYNISREGLQVYPANDMGDIAVFQNGTKVDGGHKRPPNWPPHAGKSEGETL